jgi:hypothetical protein
VKLEHASLGSEVRVRGVAHTLVARIELEATGVPGLPPMLALLAPRGRAEPSIAIFMRELAHVRPAAYAVQPGGAPLGPHEVAPEQLAGFDVAALGGGFGGAISRGDDPSVKKDHVFVP